MTENMKPVSSLSEYAERLVERALSSDGRERLRCSIWRILLSADRHLARFDMAVRRYERAAAEHDTRTMFVERENMMALLYETADTVFMTVRMIDPEVLDLHASLDGVGLAGDDAGFVNEVMIRLENLSEEIESYENEYRLRLDYSVPVDEREGVTYNNHYHWRDFSSESIEKSFYLYFGEVQRILAEQLARIPKFWRKRKMQQLYISRPSLSRLLRNLLTASLGEERLAKEKARERLSNNIEKGTNVLVKRHWPISLDKTSIAKESSAY